MTQEKFINNKEEKEKQINSINLFLNEWSNEIPQKIIRGDESGFKNFKVRTNWFSAIFFILEFNKKYFPDSFNNEWAFFLKEFQESHMKYENRTSKEEIDKGDSLLIRAREYIENS